MKRKLFLGLAALAALTITSCQKDLVINQIPEEQPIGFGTYVGRDAQTKASETNLSAMQAAEYPGFGVFAYYTGTDLIDTDTPADGEIDVKLPAANFMSNQLVKYASSAWGYSPTKYWPTEATHKISFLAYAPYLSSPTVEADGTTGAPLLTFSVNSTVNNQVDLLYSTPVLDATNTTGEVAFNFKHALSRIGFKVNTTNINSNKNKVEVNSITLSGNFTTRGKCDLSNGSFTSVTEEAATYISSFTTNNVAMGSTPFDLMESAADQYIMIIPTDEFQSTTKIGISVNYDLYVFDDMLTDNYSAPINKTATGEIDGITFEKGQAYTLVVTISPDNAITFTATVSPWEPTVDSSGTPVTTPTDEDVEVQ